VRTFHQLDPTKVTELTSDPNIIPAPCVTFVCPPAASADCLCCVCAACAVDAAAVSEGKAGAVDDGDLGVDVKALTPSATPAPANAIKIAAGILIAIIVTS
jgi:hypothetical protein